VRHSYFAVGAVALALGLATLVFADDEKDKVKASPGCLEGQIVKTFKADHLVELKVDKIILHVETARIYDDTGKELVREDKTAWFTKDAGWASLKDGMHVRADYGSTRTMAAPKDLAKEHKGEITVYNTEALFLLKPETKTEKKPETPAPTPPKKN
jgi:hypothetical protein